MEQITLVNGNGRPYTIPLPKLVMISEYDLNEIVLAHIEENTGLHFVRGDWGHYEAQPEESSQIIRLFATYNFKTRYFNNATIHNSLYLKNDHHIGFDVDSICFDCCEKNHVPTHGLSKDSRLAC